MTERVIVYDLAEVDPDYALLGDPVDAPNGLVLMSLVVTHCEATALRAKSVPFAEVPACR